MYYYACAFGAVAKIRVLRYSVVVCAFQHGAPDLCVLARNGGLRIAALWNICALQHIFICAVTAQLLFCVPSQAWCRDKRAAMAQLAFLFDLLSCLQLCKN